AGGRVVAGDDLVVAALLLRVEDVAPDRERRPARPDRPAPQLGRPRPRPVGRDPDAANDAVAAGAAKAEPRGGGGRRGRRRRGGGAGGWAGAGAGGGAGGWRRAGARRRSWGVGDHRQWRSAAPSPDSPPVRRSVSTPHARRMLPASAARRGPRESHRLIAVQP